MINTTIGKYKIIRLIGEGGMASVYEAKHEVLGVEVAIKVLNPVLSTNPQIRERFKNEAKLMASLNHPNITKVIDFEEQDQHLSIIMELLIGEDLNEKIKRSGPLPRIEIKSIFSQTLSAFQYAHEMGIIHRDIKPSNIFILPNGQVKILDFGIAKLFGQGNEMTQTGAQMGTPIYMSPEQVRADKSIDHRSDIYSLGVTLFYALNGRPPYHSDSESQFDIFNKIVYDPLPEIPNFGTFNHFIKTASQKDREKRFQSCEEWLQQMNKDSDNQTEDIPVKKTVTNPQTPQKRNINTKHLFLGVSLIFLLGYVFSKFFNNDGRDRVAIEWVSIPAGNFLMGSPRDEYKRDDDENQHSVSVDAFKMSKYEVTFQQYDAFCDATGRNKPDDEGWGRGNRPVINVSWDDANAFAAWMDCRLPTEAEWEYAARAGSTTAFNTGNCISTEHANFDGDLYRRCPHGENRKKTLPVGHLNPNEWGLYDMHGNVWEWCSDWYAEDAAENPSDSEDPAPTAKRVRRGGSWKNPASYCRSANRFANEPSYFSDYIGFRLVAKE
jgi:sulfatase modifying factor 1